MDGGARDIVVVGADALGPPRVCMSVRIGKPLRRLELRVGFDGSFGARLTILGLDSAALPRYCFPFEALASGFPDSPREEPPSRIRSSMAAASVRPRLPVGSSGAKCVGRPVADTVLARLAGEIADGGM